MVDNTVALDPKATTSAKTVTADELVALEAELADGQYLVVEAREITVQEKKMTWAHTLIIKTLLLAFEAYLRTHPMGLVLPDGARYVLAGTKTDIQRTTQPDLSFVRQERITPDFDWHGDFYGAPDFAVEIISPGQSNKTLTQKVYRYLDAGTEEVWFINATKKTITQYRTDDSEPRVYTADEVIATPLFPALNLVTSAVFEQ